MQVVTGAMGSLLPKLGQLLVEEYNLQKNAKKGVESLMLEMKIMHAALCKVAEVPRDQLDELVKLWADEVRDLSYDIEDAVDKFLVRIDGSNGSNKPTDDGNKLTYLVEKMGNLFTKGKARRQIASAIKDINKQVQEVANRRGRYTVDNIVPKPTVGTTIDPRLRALYTEVTELVGIYGKRDQELVKLLSFADKDPSKKKLKIVSVVGFGGLGKTTLVRAVYDKIKGGFDSQAFVPVGRNPDVKKIFRDILIGLEKNKYTNINLMVLDERQLIEEIREFLEDKRYLVIIDDIWDGKLWGDIKLAFSNMNNLGSRLITTTRIFTVSEACCRSAHDSVYKMEPLSSNDSARLFYKRIFSSENGCPSELKEISRDILKKCGGVPLAILTIASLLSSGQQTKPKIEWHVVLNSIGRGLTEEPSMEEMQRILSLSYYDLPSCLKTCLLYLSTYPEDHEIYKTELVWKWICETFVQHEKKQTSIFEVGETYFNELINRSMIQPIYNDFREVKSCRVHDMVLDLIRSLSGEAKFVTILDTNRDITCSHTNIRRLSLQNMEEDQQTTPLIKSMNISQVRSVTVFSPAMTMIPAISSFGVLRVLDLSECNLGAIINLRDVVYLFHLRYLGLRNTGVRELPKEIGNLQFLQVLDVECNFDMTVLPASMSKLKWLMAIKVLFSCNWVPGVLGNLTSLEVLETIYAYPSIVQELGNLARLRKLIIHFFHWSPELEEAFVESMCNLRDIQSVVIFYQDLPYLDLLGERWLPPRCLGKFQFLTDDMACSTLPMWIMRCGPSHLSNLSTFHIRVKEVQQEDVQILGRLPALRHLWISSTHQTERLLVIGADGFRSMIALGLHCVPATQLVFQQGALPNAELVRFNLGVQVTKEDGNGHHFGLGLGNLLSLQSASVEIHWDGVTIMEAAKACAAVRSALNAHPNHLSSDVRMEPDPEEKEEDNEDEEEDDNDEEEEDDDEDEDNTDRDD
ncbi:disease resistance protein PIK6-NP-like [Hordeum vulgare subsp. vulgare]|uniref:disease resistance protein PIK6-NP-like n=1 Tax=Hordeum vulgare subsp. vulgare TaxID=112509 RepID=UPI001D1A39A6|nr:disease resistance protein PIK6-NP-like [Hordeum vulgare subsp. vulgare]